MNESNDGWNFNIVSAEPTGTKEAQIRQKYATYVEHMREKGLPEAELSEGLQTSRENFLNNYASFLAERGEPNVDEKVGELRTELEGMAAGQGNTEVAPAWTEIETATPGTTTWEDLGKLSGETENPENESVEKIKDAFFDDLDARNWLMDEKGFQSLSDLDGLSADEVHKLYEEYEKAALGGEVGLDLVRGAEWPRFMGDQARDWMYAGWWEELSQGAKDRFLDGALVPESESLAKWIGEKRQGI